MPEVVEWRVFIEEGALGANKELFDQVEAAMKHALPVLGEARNDICKPYDVLIFDHNRALMSLMQA